MSDLIKSIEAPANTNIPELFPGDAVSVHVKIREGNRERIQEFKGTVLIRQKLRQQRQFYCTACCQQRCRCRAHIFTRSPRIDKVVVERHTKVRKARLFFLRGRTGKSARLKQKFS